MVVYFSTEKGNTCCFIGNVKELLRALGYTIYTSRGLYLKVDTVMRTCFGSRVKEDFAKVFTDASSWAEIKNTLN